MRTCLLISLLLALAFSSCYYDNEEDLYSSMCDLDSVTWSGTIEPLMQGHCAITGCHVAGGDGPGDFNIYSAVVSAQASIRQQAVNTTAMPSSPGEPLTRCERKQLGQWLDAGAPNN